MVLGEALEQHPPVAGAARVQLGGGGGAILGQPFDVEDASGVGEPVAPERPRVAEHVEVDREPRQRPNLRQSATPTATPTASIRTSQTDPTRPVTKCWCSSSETA